MKKKNSKLVAWRLSNEARKILSEAARKSGKSKTEIVEICVAQYALKTPDLADSVKKSLVEFVARKLGNDEKGN